MILAEDILLLLLEDASGKAVVDKTRLDLALAGGVLLDLTTLGRVDVAAAGEQVKAGRLVVRDVSTTGDDVLDEALRRLSAMRPKKPESVLGDVGVPARELRRRAKDASEGGFADVAVRRAVQAVNAATTAAVMSATAAGGVVSS